MGEYLFSSTSTSKEQENLIVILTPYVVDKSEKLSQLQKNLGILATIQKEYDKNVFKRIKERGKVEDFDMKNIELLSKDRNSTKVDDTFGDK